MPIRINDRILIKNKYLGVIRFIGKIENKEGYWVGIELDQNKGRNDGSFENKEYFKCKENHGIFIRYKKLDDSINKENLLLKKNENLNKSFSESQNKEIEDYLNSSYFYNKEIYENEIEKETYFIKSKENNSVEEIIKKYDNNNNDNNNNNYTNNDNYIDINNNYTNNDNDNYIDINKDIDNYININNNDNYIDINNDINNDNKYINNNDNYININKDNNKDIDNYININKDNKNYNYINNKNYNYINNNKYINLKKNNKVLFVLENLLNSYWKNENKKFNEYYKEFSEIMKKNNIKM